MKRILLVMLALGLWPTLASAHGDTPLAEEIDGVGDGQWVLRTNFGLVTSDDPAHYVCEEAFAGGDDFQVATLGLHEWLLFTHDTVIYSPDGCNFEIRQEIARKPAGVAASPDRSRAAYLVNVDDPAEGGVWWSEDSGATVEQAALDTADLHLSRAAFLDNARLVVSGYSSVDATRGEATLVVVNLDDGSTEELGGVDGLKYPYLFDATADSLVWLARDDAGQKIFWGPIDDPARHELAVESWPSGAELSDDGQRVWISGALAEARGVILGDATADPVFSTLPLENHSALCVGAVEDERYLCARRDREGHDLSRVVDDGSSVEPVVFFEELEGPRTDCPADSDVTNTCPSVWPELAPALDIEVDGSADAGNVADATSGGGTKGGGGCTCASAGSTPPVGWWFLLGMVVLAWTVCARQNVPNGQPRNP